MELRGLSASSAPGAVRGHVSAARKARCALLGEGCHAFRVVAGSAELALHIALEVELLVEGMLPAAPRMRTWSRRGRASAPRQIGAPAHRPCRRSSASSTHCQIMPQAAACSAGQLVAQQRQPHARAHRRPAAAGTRCRPNRESAPAWQKACTKLALRAAMTISQASAMLAPAPAATPLTAAITGMGKLCSASTSGL